MSRISRLLTAAFFLLLLATCSKPKPAGIPEHLLEIMEANRAIALPPFSDDFAERTDVFLTQGLTSEEDDRISRERSWVALARGQGIRAISSANNPVGSISREDAAKDINFLFDLMKYGYAGYQHFGGDEVFLPIRNSMLERLEKMPGAITGGVLLQEFLVPGLRTAIADNHFQLHDVTLGASGFGARINEEFVLYQGQGGFTTTIKNVAYRLVGATLFGQEVDGILPTLTREGEAAFVFGHVADWGQLGHLGPARMTVHLEAVGSGEELSLDVRLGSMANFGRSDTVLYQYEAKGVPVVVNRTLSEPHLTNSATGRFRESGRSLRGSPVIVLDLRGHSGGVPGPIISWINALTTGSSPSGRAFGTFDLESRTNDNFMRTVPVWTKNIPEASTLPLSNESLIVVLTDNNMASVGDLIVGYLRELENVLFVGTNTRGVILTGGIKRNVLPRSNITVVFGTQLHLRPDFSQFEGVGFLPDLWVPPTESLERVLAFIERYGLAHK